MASASKSLPFGSGGLEMLALGRVGAIQQAGEVTVVLSKL
jgi:hypothetical protein